METVRRYLDRAVCSTSEEACYRIAIELRGEINGLWAAMNGAVTARPGKKEQARREAVIYGMKRALMLALGLPLGPVDGVDAFLEEFRQDRIDASRSARQRADLKK
jgi:hypothetical protein